MKRLKHRIQTWPKLDLKKTRWKIQSIVFLSSHNFKCPAILSVPDRTAFCVLFSTSLLYLLLLGTPRAGGHTLGSSLRTSFLCCWLTDSSFRGLWPAWSCGWRFRYQLCCISSLHNLQKLAPPTRLVHHPTRIRALAWPKSTWVELTYESKIMQHLI